MMMRRALITSVLIAASCTSKPSDLLGPLPDNASELLGTLCAHANEGTLEADGDFETAKIEFAVHDETPFPPGLEAIQCVPEEGPNPRLNSLVFDRETRRLYGLAIGFVSYGDMDTLEQLLLPALTESERAGFALEKIRLNAPWIPTTADHFWTDGHTYIWTRRSGEGGGTSSLGGWDAPPSRWPPRPQSMFQIKVSTRK